MTKLSNPKIILWEREEYFIMIARRGRIGLIIPSANITAEYECPKLVPEGISVHFSRIYINEVSDPNEKEKALLEMGKNAIRAAGELSSIKPKVIAFCCTSGSFIKGRNYNDKIINNIEKKLGITTITTSSAVIEAFKILNLKKISMVTPYNDEIAEKEVYFFEKAINNFKVLKVINLGIIEALPKGNVSPTITYNLAREVNSSESQAIFISCTNLRTIEIIDRLEKDLNKPVVTSNQATVWAILKKMHVSGVDGYGKLFNYLGS